MRGAMFLKVSKKKQIDMPLCKYGLACTRRDCVFRHPPKPKPVEPAHSEDSSNEAADLCLPYLAGTCAFGDSCFSHHPSLSEVDRLKSKFASKWCRFGSSCKTKGCLFRHHPPSSPSSPVTTPTCTTVPTVFASGPVFRPSPPSPPPPALPVLIPLGVFLSYDDSLASHAFAIQDPIQRFAFVNDHHSLNAPSTGTGATTTSTAVTTTNGTEGGTDDFVLDLHFQSSKSVEVVLDQILPQIVDYLASPLAANKHVWLVTGVGKHVPALSHQKPGGVLFDAVLDYVQARLKSHDDLDIHPGVDAKAQSPSAVRIRKKK